MAIYFPYQQNCAMTGLYSKLRNIRSKSVTCPDDGNSGVTGKEKQGLWKVSWGILTSASLRTTSTMLPITMRESNVFQASLK